MLQHAKYLHVGTLPPHTHRSGWRQWNKKNGTC